MPCPFTVVGSTDTYSTVPGVYDETVVATKVGNDFQFYGLRGVNGTTITLNNNVIDISAGGGGGATLQSAYNAGNQIITSNANPVYIQATNQQAFVVADAGPTGVFSITNAAAGHANIVISSAEGLVFNRPITAAAPTPQDPFMKIQVAAPPSAVNTASTIQAAANIGAATAANDVYSYPDPPGLANVVTMVDLDVVGYSSALNASFAIKALGKLFPATNTVALINTASSVDAPLAGLHIDVYYTSNTIHFALVGGPAATDYLVRSSARVTVLTY